MQLSEIQKSQNINSNTVLRRVADKDKMAIDDCINKYGNLIWSLAKEASASKSDADVLTEKIFNDIWHYAARFDAAEVSENEFIMFVVQHRLSKFKRTH